jgi:hypothetical protein
MARGLGLYGEAKIQDRLWTPDLLGSEYYIGFSAKDIAAIAITSGSSVDSWADLLRNGRNATSVSAKPVYSPSRFLNNPCVTFSNSPMDSVSGGSGSIPSGSTYSWLILARDNNPSAIISEPFSVGISLSSSSMELVLDYDGSTSSGVMCGFNTAVQGKISGSPIKSMPTLIGIGLNSGYGWARVNGRNGTAGVTIQSTSTNPFRIGGSRPQSTFPFNGDIYCILAIGSAIGSPSFFAAEGWMAWEFGMSSLLLPASHPFANRPPLIGD